MDLGDVLKFLVVLLVVIVPAISQVVAKLREAQKPPPAPPRAPRPPQPAGESFKDEIEEFLRRAAEGQPQGRAAKSSGSPAGPRPRAPRRPAQPKPAPAPAAAEPVSGRVVEHVQKHLDTSEFARRTRQLGGEVAEADEKIDARVHDVFEHQLSQFDWRTPAELETAGELPRVTEAATSAASLLPLLTNPDSLRQAIVLNEILSRPEDRW